MHSILVTGGAGYVGSHVCKALAQAGYVPVAYDDLSTGHADLVRWGPLEQGSLTDADRLSQVMERHRPLAAMHFAAQSLVGLSTTDPSCFYRTNVSGTLALLDAMRCHGIGHVVLSSSCAVYGVPQRLPMTEDSPCRPVNPYGWSKLMAERLLADFGGAYGLNWAALRYFNAAGADPEGETGEDHRPETHLIPRALLAAAGEVPYLDVFGGDWPTEDGTCVRDYVHVADLARWHVLVLRHLLSGHDPVVLNLGTGQGWSVRQVLGAVERVTGRAVPFRLMGRRQGDPAVLVADPSRAASLLGAPPLYPDLDGMVESAWRFMRNRHRLPPTERTHRG